MKSDDIDHVQAQLIAEPRAWLVTGAAGFVGSHLVERLLRWGQHVVGIDNFTTGHRSNLEDVRREVGDGWNRFKFVQADIRKRGDCRRALDAACRAGERLSGPPIVLHQAALGSVPRSMADPQATTRCNVNGFLNVLMAAHSAGVRRFVFASSSSVYGDHAALPKREEVVGRPLSPYAASKVANELLAEILGKQYGMNCIGLRYFNVFGPRQDPDGPYAAVIPRWINALLAGESPTIHGNGEVSRDFCFVDNVVQANLLAATTDHPAAANQVYNVAVGQCMSLNELFGYIRAALVRFRPDIAETVPNYGPSRTGDIHHSHASIEKATTLLNYNPKVNAMAGIPLTVQWYASRFEAARHLPREGNALPAFNLAV